MTAQVFTSYDIICGYSRNIIKIFFANAVFFARFPEQLILTSSEACFPFMMIGIINIKI